MKLGTLVVAAIAAGAMTLTTIAPSAAGTGLHMLTRS